MNTYSVYEFQKLQQNNINIKFSFAKYSAPLYDFNNSDNICKLKVEEIITLICGRYQTDVDFKQTARSCLQQPTPSPVQQEKKQWKHEYISNAGDRNSLLKHFKGTTIFDWQEDKLYIATITHTLLPDARQLSSMGRNNKT